MTESARKGLSAKEAETLGNRIVSSSRADQVRVNMESGWRGYTRVATNRITSAGGSDDVNVRITSVFGKRVAAAGTNIIDDKSLEDAVRRSEDLARLAPENPEYMSELAVQRYDRVSGYYSATGGLAPESRARAAGVAIEKARARGLVAAGFMDVRAGSEAVVTSAGLFAHHAGTGVASTLTVRTSEGSSSGWAGDEAGDWTRIDSERIAADAVEKCSAWREKSALGPGKYTVILEPTAVGMLMLRMAAAFTARPADEGRSYFSKPGGGNRLGEALFDPKITIMSDPAAPNAETAPFTGEGEPVSQRVWVEGGVLKSLAYSRYWADKKGVASSPAPSNFIMSGGDAPIEEMIRSTERGLLITRFWYIRGLNPQTLSQTGLTRDGTFLIEKGKISRPVNNFRFNQSLVELLQNVEMLGKPVRVAAGESSSVGMPVVVPAMKVTGFNLSSVSDAI